MDTNQTPAFDMADNPTGCCPRFHPEGWDAQDLHFKDKLFVRAKTHSLFHVPLDMSRVFQRTFQAIEAAHADGSDQFIVLSRELSPWSAEHLFAVTNAPPELEMVRLSGDYRTKVFEGPFQQAPKWEAMLRSEFAANGETAGKIYFFYTTCPSCAKIYGKNYVVGIAERATEGAAQ
jgi:hypothetical protein